MPTVTYKCPQCGSPLMYDGRHQTLHCDSCSGEFDAKTVQAVNAYDAHAEHTGNSSSWSNNENSYSDSEERRMRAFSCQSCGAQLMTDETTIATNCAFCGSPSIIPEQFTETSKPQKIIPFIITKQQATEKFHKYFKGKKLIPNLFIHKNSIDEIRQLYVPYWLFDCRTDAKISYDARQVSVYTSGNYRVTTTRHFLLRREGTLDFENLPVDASPTVDNEITESIEPYNMTKAILFSLETLSGAMANRAGVSAEECKQRADERIRASTEQTFMQTTRGYQGVHVRSSSINIPDGICTPVLFPVWIITTKKEGKTYTFAINGQTGELTCNVPYSKPKFFAWLFGVFFGTFAVGYGVYQLLLNTGVIR